MAKWITITKSGADVRLKDGSRWTLGEKVNVGAGAFELRETKKAGLHVVRFSGRGNYRYHIKLGRDGQYRLGAHRGHRIVPATEEKDPIKRILREMDLPVSILQRATTPTLEVGERWYDNGHCPNGRNTNRWIHDGRRTEMSSEELEKPRGFFRGGGYDTAVIEDASYAVRFDKGRGWSRPGAVVVWDKCDPTTLANALAPLVWGQDADAEYIEALKSFEAAQQWVESRLSRFKTPHDMGDGIVVQHHEVLDRLVRKHGMRLIEPHLSAQQRALLRAKEEVAEAVRYVFAYYRVVAVQCGDKRHLKFALVSSPEELGDIDSEEQPLSSLLEQHKSLKDTLFDQATERRELVPTHSSCRGFRVRDGMWEVHTDVDGRYQSDDFRPLLREEDAIAVSLRDETLAKALLCLSDRSCSHDWILAEAAREYTDLCLSDTTERRQGVRQPNGGFHAAHRDGDEAFVNAYEALLPLRVGETKSFVFRVAHAWANPDFGASVWGVTVTRKDASTVEFLPYDNGKNYTCAGSWGGEVSAN